MKKILLIVSLFAIGISSAYCQLNIIQSNTKEKVYLRNNDVAIKFDGHSYVINCKDLWRPYSFTLNLGSTLEEAILSLEQIDKWRKNAKAGDYISIQQDDSIIVTLYLYQVGTVIISYGDVDYILNKRQEMSRRAFMALAFDISSYHRETYDNFDPYICEVYSGIFLEAIQNIYYLEFPERLDELNLSKRQLKNLKYRTRNLNE